MKSVLISIRPEWCEKIASGEKTVEVRKTRPKIEPPFKVYVYCTLPPKEELFTHGCIREYARELIRLQDGRIVYDYGMRLCCDPEDRPYSQDNFLCQKVIGEFVCDNVAKILNFLTHFGVEGRPERELNTIARASCLDYMDMLEYFGTDKDGYAWHISDLKIYDHPKKLSEFCSYDARIYIGENGLPMPTHEITRPPQPWCYVEGGE